MKPHGKQKKARNVEKPERVEPGEAESKKVLERIAASKEMASETAPACNYCGFPGNHCSCCRMCGVPFGRGCECGKNP